MGFKAYHARPVSSRRWILDHGTPMRLSGPTGLVALWIRSHQIEINVPWRIAPQDWLPAILPPAGEGEEPWILFEQAEHGVPSFARLTTITGVAERKVELMLTFVPLHVHSAGPRLEVELESIGRQWTEELALDGGPLSAHCTWRLTRPHLALGAAVLRPAPS